MAKRFEDYYSMLGLPRSVSQREIRDAYLKAAKRLHPDKNVGPGETELFMDVQQAYQVLSNPALRAAYDATLGPEVNLPTYINSQIFLSRTSLSPLTEKQLAYILIEVSPTSELIRSTGPVPINLCLVLDCSTSMDGDKLNTVKSTAIQILNKLKPNDIFSIVTFNDRAQVVIPAARKSDLQQADKFIRFLQVSGGTEIFQGLNAGYEEVSRYHNSKYINHIILLTDGHTYGDEEVCYDLAKKAASKNIGISGIGIGNDWNDSFLDKLAHLSSGHCILVKDPRDIENFLLDKFMHLSNTIVDNVFLDYELGDGVEISYIFRTQPETDTVLLENPLKLGALVQDGYLSILIELTINALNANNEKVKLIKGNLDFSTFGLDAPIPAIPINLFLPVKNTGTLVSPPANLMQALSRLTMFRMQEKARSEVIIGNYSQAAVHLQRLATRMLANGEQKLAKTIMLEIRNIESDNKISGAGEKEIKYGTRALLLPEENI
ncbi:MAG: VWA domain-containing protein [Chloroflexota bacterium]